MRQVAAFPLTMCGLKPGGFPDVASAKGLSKECDLMIQTEGMPERKLLLERAAKCGDWMVRNQFTDRLDANRGRCIRSYDMDTKETNYTGNWMTGCMLNALLALWKRTGDGRYLHAAEMAGRYIVSLQVMDRDDRHFGAIREITPQSLEFAPRDSSSGAWGLVWLAEATKNDLYLQRARLYGDWLVEKGMYRGWPLFACYLDPSLETFYSRGSFQSGSGLFLYDLFMLTGDPKYIERGLEPIARIYRDDFVLESGELVLERDPFTNEITCPKEGDSTVYHHRFNDDFGSAMLIAASRLLNDPSYLDAAVRFTRNAVSHQDLDGGFGGGAIPPAVPVVGMLCLDLGEILGDEPLKQAAARCLSKQLATQFLDTGDAKIDGAFQGMYEGEDTNPKGHRCMNMRTTAYALQFLLKAESDLADIWLGIHNRQYRDRRWSGLYDLVW